MTSFASSHPLIFAPKHFSKMNTNTESINPTRIQNSAELSWLIVRGSLYLTLGSGIGIGGGMMSSVNLFKIPASRSHIVSVWRISWNVKQYAKLLLEMPKIKIVAVDYDCTVSVFIRIFVQSEVCRLKNLHWAPFGHIKAWIENK